MGRKIIDFITQCNALRGRKSKAGGGGINQRSQNNIHPWLNVLCLKQEAGAGLRRRKLTTPNFELFKDGREWKRKREGEFLLTTGISIVSAKRVSSMDTYSGSSNITRGSEQKWVSKPMIGVSEWSKVERCRVSKQSERCERTNIASDRVARQRHDCHRVETDPEWNLNPFWCHLSFSLSS